MAVRSYYQNVYRHEVDGHYSPTDDHLGGHSFHHLDGDPADCPFGLVSDHFAGRFEGRFEGHFEGHVSVGGLEVSS